MMWRVFMRCALLVSLVALTACASYSAPGRTAPRAAEIYESAAQPATAPDTADVEIDAPLQRDELPPQDTPPTDDSRLVTPAPTTPASPRSAATTLLEEVDAAVAQGDLERAAALSERALRIEPRDAFLWYRLASIRAQQGRVAEANGFARRALSFSSSNPALTRQINELLGTLQ